MGQRTNEIGIRRALGASNSAILLDVLHRGVTLIAAGLVLGLGISLAMTRLLQTLLWRITATDPLTFSAVASVMAAIGLLACYLPSRRAVKVDPAIALRTD
jgi:putative ABC transport system permease protein